MNSAKPATEFAAHARTIMLNRNCNWDTAWKAARAEKPELWRKATAGQPPALRPVHRVIKNRDVSSEAAAQSFCQHVADVQRTLRKTFHDAWEYCKQKYPELFAAMEVSPAGDDGPPAPKAAPQYESTAGTE